MLYNCTKCEHIILHYQLTISKADINKRYYKPTTKKFHRYFVDLYIEFENNQKFLVEIKSYKETIKPTIPKKKTQKAILNYNKAEETYAINLCKWKAAEAFCQERGIRFLILTERELK